MREEENCNWHATHTHAHALQAEKQRKAGKSRVASLDVYGSPSPFRSDSLIDRAIGRPAKGRKDEKN